MAVFTKLKKLELYSMELDGKIGSTRSERFIFATEIDVAFYAGPLPKVLPISLEVFNLGDSLETPTSSLVESRLNGAL